jgi:hypothetical protein
MGVLDRFLRVGEGKKVKALQSLVPDISALEPEMEALSDNELRAKTPEFRQRLERGETLDDLLIEAFAVVREAGKRVLGQRHFDVQITSTSASSTPATSPTAPTTSSASTTCATTWRRRVLARSSGATSTPSWTRSTRSWSTRPGRR